MSWFISDVLIKMKSFEFTQFKKTEAASCLNLFEMQQIIHLYSEGMVVKGLLTAHLQYHPQCNLSFVCK